MLFGIKIYFSFSRFRFLPYLILLVVLQTSFGWCQHAGMLCGRPFQLQCGRHHGDNFDHAGSRPTWVSETVLMASVATSLARAAVIPTDISRASLDVTFSFFSRFDASRQDLSLASCR